MQQSAASLSTVAAFIRARQALIDLSAQPATAGRVLCPRPAQRLCGLGAGARPRRRNWHCPCWRRGAAAAGRGAGWAGGSGGAEC